MTLDVKLMKSPVLVADHGAPQSAGQLQIAVSVPVPTSNTKRELAYQMNQLGSTIGVLLPFGTSMAQVCPFAHASVPG